ncbi:MAG TPA: toll/interleukin-1 receptor domain-containing protein [Rhizomicrobium sp.]|jgi:hypothetical protein|nr:toll/interleukin-1 receptor domain-containing protein [Rhizomicrobium sp.]
MAPPKVFISYSHDSQLHKEWVLRLATDLRVSGIDVTLDQWDLSLGQDMSMFMQDGIALSDRVILICSDSYVTKAEVGKGGVGYERLIVTAEVVQTIDTRKFIPLIRGQSSDPKVPKFLGPRLFVDFSKDEQYGHKLKELSQEILGIRPSKPPVGAPSFSGALQHVDEPVRIAGPTGGVAGGVPVLNDAWFISQIKTASTGLSKSGLRGYMAIRFALHATINKTQIELLDGMRKSTIPTFGWPIGIMLENRDEYRPRPLGDGIRAEVAIADGGPPINQKSYDYWALRSNGDFYSLLSLFEDERTTDALFFNTRIVRVAEALLLASNLYAALGVPPEIRLSVRITHGGLRGRVLSSSSASRFIVRAPHCIEESSETEAVLELGKIRERLVGSVRQFTEPLFMLFDFARFEDNVYDDLVKKFVAGRVT